MAMGLQWAVCSVCGERKPLQKSGAMCIHVDSDSVRCLGSGLATTPEADAAPRPDRSGRVKYKRGQITPSDVLETEMQAAFAAVKRKGRTDPPADGPMDRRIYAVKGAHIVSGGLPTHGRNR